MPEITEAHMWPLAETLRLLSVQSCHSNKHLNVCTRHPCLPMPRLLLHMSLEKREANNLNKRHLILWLPVDVHIWGASTFSFQVCSVSGIQLSLWRKWRPYLFLVFPFPHPCLLSITPWPFTDWLQLRPWISFSWTKVRLQCKNNKGMCCSHPCTVPRQHLDFTWDSHISRASNLLFEISSFSLQETFLKSFSYYFFY